MLYFCTNALISKPSEVSINNGVHTLETRISGIHKIRTIRGDRPHFTQQAPLINPEWLKRDTSSQPSSWFHMRNEATNTPTLQHQMVPCIEDLGDTDCPRFWRFGPDNKILASPIIIICGNERNAH